MEFGIFNAACVLPQYIEKHGASAEHDRIMDEVAFIVAADKAGFKYTWASEHHFLTDYSHLSASESFLAFVAAKTNNIHIGSGIFNITPPVNHPARIAERVAMLDHLSEGRFEFGTGRGSSTTEQKGFGIQESELTREMVAETLPQIVRMWKDEDYSYEGKFFSMPTRNVLPKPYSKPHPPIWMAAGSPSTFDLAAELGVGVLCFGFSTPDQLTPLVSRYKEKIQDCTNPVGGFVNNNVMITTQMICMEDGAKARKTFLEADSNYHLSLVFRYLDTFPRPPGIPEWPEIIPAMDAATLDAAIAAGVTAVGTPDEVGKAVESFAATGADQLAFGMLSTSMEIESCQEAVETFGKHVLKDFDKDPEHLHDQAAARRRVGSYRDRPPGGPPPRSGPTLTGGTRRPRAGGRSPRPPRPAACPRVDPVALLDAVALELRPEVVDHVGVRQRTGVRRLEPAVLHPLLDHPDGCPQHGVVERDAVRRAGLREEVEHERVEDALGDGEVAALGERRRPPRPRHEARPGSARAPPRATARSHPAAAWRRTSPGRGRRRARGGRPPAAPPWSCRTRASR